MTCHLEIPRVLISCLNECRCPLLCLVGDIQAKLTMKHLLQRESNFPIEFNDKTEAVTLNKKKNVLGIELSTLGDD